MAEQPRKPTSAPPGDADHIPDMSQEMDSAGRSLPPALPVLIAAIVIGGLLYWNAHTHRSKTPASGRISKLAVVEQQTGDRVLVLTELQVQNSTDRPIYVHSLQAKLVTDGAEATDDASSGADIPRYVQAYPALGQSSVAPLINNTKIQPGTTQEGIAVFGFEVPKAKFDSRKSFEVTIKFYDQLPLVLKQ